MSIEDYRTQLGWSLAELARRADIDVNTVKRAIEGTPVRKEKAGDRQRHQQGAWKDYHL